MMPGLEIEGSLFTGAPAAPQAMPDGWLPQWHPDAPRSGGEPRMPFILRRPSLYDFSLPQERSSPIDWDYVAFLYSVRSRVAQLGRGELIAWYAGKALPLHWWKGWINLILEWKDLSGDPPTFDLKQHDVLLMVDQRVQSWRSTAALETWKSALPPQSDGYGHINVNMLAEPFRGPERRYLRPWRLMFGDDPEGRPYETLELRPGTRRPGKLSPTHQKILDHLTDRGFRAPPGRRSEDARQIAAALDEKFNTVETAIKRDPPRGIKPQYEALPIQKTG